MVMIDAVARLVPGVLGDEESNRQDSFSGEERLLEFSQYTRPREYRGHEVPPVLLSGDHEEIARWRKEQSLQRTESDSGPICGLKNKHHPEITIVTKPREIGTYRRQRERFKRLAPPCGGGDPIATRKVRFQ